MWHQRWKCSTNDWLLLIHLIHQCQKSMLNHQYRSLMAILGKWGGKATHKSILAPLWNTPRLIDIKQVFSEQIRPSITYFTACRIKWNEIQPLNSSKLLDDEENHPFRRKSPWKIKNQINPERLRIVRRYSTFYLDTYHSRLSLR